MESTYFTGDQESLPAVRVALVDSDCASHALLGETFRQVAPNWSLESYFSPYAALQRLPASPPHAVLVDDWEAANLEPILVRQIRAEIENVPLLVFTKRTTAPAVIMSLMAGATGFLMKPISDAELVRALIEAVLGSIVLCQQSREVLAAHLRQVDRTGSSRHLTFREKETLLSFAGGACPKEIANDLGVATSTVRAHLRNVYRKLEAHDCHEAIRKFLGLSQAE